MCWTRTPANATAQQSCVNDFVASKRNETNVKYTKKTNCSSLHCLFRFLQQKSVLKMALGYQQTLVNVEKCTNIYI